MPILRLKSIDAILVAIKYFLIKACKLFLFSFVSFEVFCSPNAIAHLIDYSVNITFICTGKPKESPHASLYFLDIRIITSARG